MRKPRFTLQEYMVIAESMQKSEDPTFKHIGESLTYTKIEHREALANLFKKEFLMFLKKRDAKKDKFRQVQK